MSFNHQSHLVPTERGFEQFGSKHGRVSFGDDVVNPKRVFEGIHSKAFSQQKRLTLRPSSPLKDDRFYELGWISSPSVLFGWPL